MSTIINATTANGVVIQPDNSGSLVLQTNNGTTAVTIDTSQNVGIGTTSPSGYAAKLSVIGNGIYTNYGYALTVDSTYFTPSGLTAIPNYGLGNPASSQVSLSAFAGLTFYTNQAERMRIDSSGNLLFNSGYGSVATAYGCRAWVNFNGTGTVAIRASGNVSSITDGGVGLYTVNMTNALTDINYEVSASASTAVTTYCAVTIFADGTGARVAPTTTAFRLSTWNASSLLDASDICASVFR